MFDVQRTSPVCPLCSGPGRFFYADETRGQTYHSCGFCELIWMDPADRLNASEERSHYEQHTNTPEDHNYRAFLKRLWEPLKTQLMPGASGLDYGSGPGPTLHLMAQEDGFDCTHYDPFFHPDASAFEHRYAFITCSETAEHFHKPAEEFRKLAALLKPRGILGIMTSMHRPDTDFAKWHYRIDPTHVAFYSKRSFEVIADTFGFFKIEFCGRSVVLLIKCF